MFCFVILFYFCFFKVILSFFFHLRNLISHFLFHCEKFNNQFEIFIFHTLNHFTFTLWNIFKFYFCKLVFVFCGAHTFRKIKTATGNFFISENEKRFRSVSTIMQIIEQCFVINFVVISINVLNTTKAFYIQTESMYFISN